MTQTQPIAAEDLYGQPETFTALGKEWKLGPPNQATKGFMDVEFAKLARKQLTADYDAGMYSATEYAQEQTILRDQIRAGHFRTARPGWFNYLSTVEGQDLLILSWLKVNHPDVTLDTVREIREKHEEELGLAVEALEDRFFTLVAGEMPASAREQTKAMLREQAAEFRKARQVFTQKTTS